MSRKGAASWKSCFAPESGLANRYCCCRPIGKARWRRCEVGGLGRWGVRAVWWELELQEVISQMEGGRWRSRVGVMWSLKTWC